MKRISVISLFLLIAFYTFSQEVTKPDTISPRYSENGENIQPKVIDDIRRAFESDMITGNSPDLIDVSLPEVRQPESQAPPMLYFDFKFVNKLPSLVDIDYKKGYYFSKQTNYFYFREKSLATNKGFFIDSDIDFLVNNYFSIDFTRVHSSNIYSNPLLPNSQYRDQFGLGFSFKITPNLKLKTGFERVMNHKSGKWQTIQMNTLNYGF